MGSVAISDPAFVLIHGGSFTSHYWDRLVPLLNFPAFAVDLPGRGSKPADLSRIKINDWVDSVVKDIESAGLEDVVLVGNSLAGVTMPGVAAKLPNKMRHLVFSSCTVPAHGKRAVDFLRQDIKGFLLASEEEIAYEQAPPPVHEGQTEYQMQLTQDIIGENVSSGMLNFVNDPVRRSAEALKPLFETFSWDDFPTEVPRTYIKNLRDCIVLPELQDQMIENMGGARVIELDTPHCPSISDPEIIAAILNGIAAGICYRP
jgi:pimeloyl-ACP methyl ester carboxylesterase